VQNVCSVRIFPLPICHSACSNHPIGTQQTAATIIPKASVCSFLSRSGGNRHFNGGLRELTGRISRNLCAIRLWITVFAAHSPSVRAIFRGCRFTPVVRAKTINGSHRPSGILLLVGLRDATTFVGFDDVDVRLLDPTVCVEILSEVGACHSLVYLTLNERLIGLANQTAGVRVAN
jgi:hypothetical protein